MNNKDNNMTSLPTERKILTDFSESPNGYDVAFSSLSLPWK